MVNRILIRTKVVQVVYAFFTNNSRDFEAAEKELQFSLDKSYELYNSLLLLTVALTDAQYQRLESAKVKFLSTAEERSPNTKFIDNLFVAQLRGNKMFNEYLDESGVSWNNESDFVRRTLDSVLKSELYLNYINNPKRSYEEDKELWRQLLKQVILESEDMEEWVEQKSLYWVDDMPTISTFVLKSVRKFEESNGNEQPLLPMYKDEDDRLFARDLFRQTLLLADKNRELINANIKNWELERIAQMDILIMLVALAEMQTFDSIPVRVTLNEYIEIAKSYSTAKSGRFVNGILDAIATNLKKEGVITKE